MGMHGKMKKGRCLGVLYKGSPAPRSKGVTENGCKHSCTYVSWHHSLSDNRTDSQHAPEIIIEHYLVSSPSGNNKLVSLLCNSSGSKTEQLLN